MPSLAVEEHVGEGLSVAAAVVTEERSIGVDQVVSGAAPECKGHVCDAPIAPLDFDEGANGCFVDGHNQIVEGEFLAVFLIAEPDLKAELFQNAQEQRTVSYNRLKFFAHFHVGRLDGTLKGKQALAGLHANS